MKLVNKRAQRREIKDAVLVVVVTVLLVFFVRNFVNYAKTRTNENACSTSLLLMQQTKIKDLASSPVHPQCTKEKLMISKLQNGMKELSFKKQMADAMYRCWKKTGMGDLNPFASKFFTAKYYCILCTEIQFSKDVNRKLPTVVDLKTFLKTHKPNSGVESYWDTFMSGKFNSKDTYFYSKDLKIIDTSKKYDLILVFDKSSTIGTGTTQQIMRLIPEEQIGNMPGGVRCENNLYQHYE